MSLFKKSPTGNESGYPAGSITAEALRLLWKNGYPPPRTGPFKPAETTWDHLMDAFKRAEERLRDSYEGDYNHPMLPPLENIHYVEWVIKQLEWVLASFGRKSVIAEVVRSLQSPGEGGKMRFCSMTTHLGWLKLDPRSLFPALFGSALPRRTKSSLYPSSALFETRPDYGKSPK